ATIAANNGATSRQLMAIFGWDTLAMAEHYTRAADQERLAEQGMNLLCPTDLTVGQKHKKSERNQRHFFDMPFLRERSGRWSRLKVVDFVAAVLPALWIAYQAAADELGARPVTEAIHQAGDWTLRFLLITLAIMAQRILNYPRIILARRTLGVACAGYAVLHFSLYVLDQHFDLFKVASEIVLRIYLTIGALALAGLIALASTST